MDRQNITSGAKWESIVGYSRAVRIGKIVEVSGTTSVHDGKVIHPDSAYLQTKEIIAIAEKALIEAGSKLSQVIRTRMYTTDISLWEEIGKAHGEAFSDIRPVTTMVEVSGLIDPEMLVEIEFTAYIV